MTCRMSVVGSAVPPRWQDCAQVVIDSSDPRQSPESSAKAICCCSAAEAKELGLEWSPLIEPELKRGYVLAATSNDDAADAQRVQR